MKKIKNEITSPFLPSNEQVKENGEKFAFSIIHCVCVRVCNEFNSVHIFCQVFCVPALVLVSMAMRIIEISLLHLSFSPLQIRISPE
jgi:hypothetical protein